MPPLRTLLQRLVVTFLVLLDQPLQANVTPDLITKIVALQKQQPSERRARCRRETDEYKENLG
jgi:hypothetical protein